MKHDLTYELDKAANPLREAETPKNAISQGFDKVLVLFRFTKGRFSLLDLIEPIISKTGQVQFSLSTWTASRSEAMELEETRCKFRELTS